MSTSGGIGGPGSSPVTPPTGGPESVGAPGGGVGDVMHTPIANLAQLKQLLLASYGEVQGTKLYNSFLTSFAMLMMQQVQHSAQQAQQASQNMRMDVS